MVKMASESSSQTPGNVISECPSKPTLIQLPVWLAPAIPNEEHHSGVSCLCFVKQNRAVFSSQNEEWVKAGGCDQPGGEEPCPCQDPLCLPEGSVFDFLLSDEGLERQGRGEGPDTSLLSAHVSWQLRYRPKGLWQPKKSGFLGTAFSEVVLRLML